VLGAELAASLGHAVATTFAATRVFVGRDTRESGPLLVAGVARGCAAAGAAVADLGVAPTPAVAFAAEHGEAPGIVVSASHNPWHDNGLKVFAPGGNKLTGAQQDTIEAALRTGAPAALGEDPPVSILDARDAVERWAAHVVASIEGRSLDGVSVVVDTGHGAAHAVAGPVLAGLGARVTVINAAPDGRNINDACGSTDLGPLAAAVRSAGADLGLAFDGDADRVLAVDHHGNPVDGDAIIAICALDRHRRGCPRADGVVVTVMANLGFRRAMADNGIEVVETPVGDRHVLEALARTGLVLGGEQSGHVVFAEYATTGDGLLTGVQLLDVLARARRPLAELVDASLTRFPQVLVSVPVDGDAADAVARIAGDIVAVEADLGTQGRVLVRPSGTEPVVRVMAEADTDDRARVVVQRLVEALTPQGSS
jgi:phosphoglucosamine mutase